MKISIITACFNSEKTIAETVQSVINQTYLNIEYIVIDGGSTDRTKQIISEYEKGISTYISEPDKGIYDALNKGISLATGEVVGFMHSDDLFASDRAVEEIAYQFKSSQADAVYSDLKYVACDDVSKVIRLWKSGNYHREQLKSGWMPPHPTFYMKRSLYNEFGGFDLQFKIAGDYDALLRYLWLNKISLSYVPKVLVLMRVGGISNRNLKSIIQKSKEDVRALQNNGLNVWRALIWKNLSKISQFIFK